MTLNILFFTIIIKKREMSLQDVQQYELVKQLEEEQRNRQASLPRIF
jgi:uncharacterized protein (TIGR02413 family)